MNRTAILMRRFKRILDYVIDPKVGIVSIAEEKQREPGMPRFYHFYAQACNTAHIVQQDNFRYSGGAAIDWDRAIAKAVGEAVERYCSAIYDVEELPIYSYDNAPFNCVEPESFALFSAEQYSDPDFYYAAFERSTPTHWVESFDLLDRRTVHVPACMVYMPYYFYEETGCKPISQPISTGLSCHMDLFEAIISGVCEVIERDAFTITWQARISPPQIMPETLSDKNFDIVERFEEAGCEITLFDLTMDHSIPTVLSAFKSHSQAMPAFGVAAATDLNPEKAVQLSLEELAHTRRYCQLVHTCQPLIDPGPGYENVKNQAQHLGYWADHSRLDQCNFLFTSRERVDFDEMSNLSTDHPGKDLFRLCRRIRDVGHRVLVTDLTTADARELGFVVVKVIIPGFHPLFMGYQYRALGGTRLWEVPGKLGYKCVTEKTKDNPLPHPYP